MIKNIHLIWIIFLAFSCNSGKKDSIPELDQGFETPMSPQLNALNEAIQNDGDKPDYFFKRAKIYFEDKNYRSALKDINQAIHLDNANNAYFAFLAKIYRALNKNAMALKIAKQAEGLNSQDPDLFILMAQIYSDMNDKKNADYYLNQSAILAPLHSEIYVLKGNVFARNGDTASALGQYQLALSKDRQNLDALEELAKIYDAKRKYDSSMYYIVKGKTINNREPYFDFLSGKVYEHLNLEQAAKASYEAALGSDSTFFQASIYLGNMYYKRNDLPNALKWYSYGLKYDSDIPLANQRVGEILEVSGRGEAAIPYYERASLIDTNNSKLKASLKKLYALYPDHKLVTPTNPEELRLPSPEVETAVVQEEDIYNEAPKTTVVLPKKKPSVKANQKAVQAPVESPAVQPPVVTEKKEEPKAVPSVETTNNSEVGDKDKKGDFNLKSLFKKKKKNKDTIQ